ncbi:mitotic check point protein [Capsaspora owczarzaki ATCC 30864]|uniref:Mitotic check point protein n=1 Tax=Capsaspora owczarzaki (strain ATCC 30864) TaxID=595528 RepID=A0A0D2X1M0_CAPO3|nr:mitotic check point protein [Capsaspora owczarzaki ATCC 30864]KJE91044.1 mitotic check point protein [Capsaspora owczarzaki ATCC 30864]|eukprot:XP_004348994.2 mitotic check point protein [Capsaspora owczarzaki ATCC 30864]
MQADLSLDASSLRAKYEQLLEQGNTNPQDTSALLAQLRDLILKHGIPEEPSGQLGRANSTSCTLRGRIWKVLLGVQRLDAEYYIALVKAGKAHVHQKIRNDTFRTLRSDKTFSSIVTEAELIRVLNAFANSQPPPPGSRPSSVLVTNTPSAPSPISPPSGGSGNSGAASTPGAAAQNGGSLPQRPPTDLGLPNADRFRISYVQGMNVLLAPLLYVMPELDAFYCFSRLILTCLPAYVQPTLDGVHAGMSLVDKILQRVDPQLHQTLTKTVETQLFAMPPVMTLSACTPPLHEVLQLWDFLLAFGVHCNIPCVVAQLILVRDKLLSNEKTRRSLSRQFPDLDARAIITLAVVLLRDLPDDWYDGLVRHPFAPPSDSR